GWKAAVAAPRPLGHSCSFATLSGVLSTRTLLERDGIGMADVSCRHPRGRGEAAESMRRHVLVLVRRGCFVRSADGDEQLLDPTGAYCVNPGEEERYDHPHAQGDDCTAVSLDSGVVASLWGESKLHPGPIPTSPELDLEHRLTLAAARRGADPHELVERALG